MGFWHPAEPTQASEPAPPDAPANVEGNARLTALNGLILLVLFAIEGFTVLDVEGMITLHVVIGLLLVGPVLLKCASTIYRFTRYYAGHPAYVRNGPPHPILRVLGPLVITLSLAVIGTGVALVYTGHDDTVLFLHKASFIAWFAVMTVHVLGHILQTARDTVGELGPRAPRGRPLRFALIAAALVAGLGVTAVVYPSAHEWTSHSGSDHGGPDHHLDGDGDLDGD